MTDTILRICQQLVRIDNRSHSELSASMGVTAATVRRLRNDPDIAWVRSTTVSGLIKATHREFVLKQKR